MTKKFKGMVTLCWACQNCFGGCSWSKDFQPVEGWNVKPTTVQRQPRDITQSYLVYSCPQFIPEAHLCSRCAHKLVCTFNPIQAGKSGFIADCDKFIPDEPGITMLSDKVLKEHEQREGLRVHGGGKCKRAVEQWTKDRTTHIQNFESLSAAAREVGGTSTHIARVCDNNWKSAKGYWWRWLCSE